MGLIKWSTWTAHNSNGGDERVREHVQGWANDYELPQFRSNGTARLTPTSIDRFIGEESWAAGDEGQVTDAPTWIVDPIDGKHISLDQDHRITVSLTEVRVPLSFPFSGTTNFVHGFPFTCISIGFTYKKEPTIGVM